MSEIARLDDYREYPIVYEGDMKAYRRRCKKHRKDFYSFTQIKEYFGDETTTDIVWWFIEKDIVKQENGGLVFTHREIEKRYGFMNEGYSFGVKWHQPLFNKEIVQKYIQYRISDD